MLSNETLPRFCPLSARQRATGYLGPRKDRPRTGPTPSHTLCVFLKLLCFENNHVGHILTQRARVPISVPFARVSR